MGIYDGLLRVYRNLRLVHMNLRLVHMNLRLVHMNLRLVHMNALCFSSIDLNTSLLQPLCLSKWYCIKQESRYRLLLENKNTFCHCIIWLFLISPPFHPLEKIITQALCCSTSTEKLECAPRLHCHAMKKAIKEGKIWYNNISSNEHHILCSHIALLQWHIWQPKLLDMLRSKWVGGPTEEGFQASSPNEGGGAKG